MNAAPAIRAFDETTTLVDLLIAEQRSLTAVERFARVHDHRQPGARAGQYRSLLPAGPPSPGQHYAFEVDLDRCSGCKACVTACHSLNGLEPGETWRNVGLLVSDTAAPAVGDSAFRTPHSALQHVTTACHHCLDPGCLNGCPVLAYDKDPATGIVRHLDDQCIGCQYCVMKCPYDVPKYSRQLGIVRKCDLCSNRLAAGEAPACVQACPNEAIRIILAQRMENAEDRVSNTEQDPILRNPNSDGALAAFGRRSSPGLQTSDFGLPPAFPDPAITRPTTRYVTRRPQLESMRAADATELRAGPAHLPLSWMLVLTQLGIGTALAAALVAPESALLAVLALGATLGGVTAGTAHLGQPLKAWRSFLGWRRSWLSRELLAFGAVLTVQAAHLLVLRFETAVAAAASGVAALLCSVMIYVDTERPFWGKRFTLPKFLLTTAMLGAAGGLIGGVHAQARGVANAAAAILLGVTVCKLLLEGGFVFRRSRSATRAGAALARSARLHREMFRAWFVRRLAVGFLGGVALPAGVLAGLLPAAPAVVSIVVLGCLAGELIERHLFFVCEAAPRMPGGMVA